jgi:hypothetical protein
VNPTVKIGTSIRRAVWIASWTVSPLVDEPRRRRHRVVEGRLPVPLLDHEAIQEALAVRGELGDPGDLLVGEADQREAILRPQLVDEVPHRLLRRVELAALPHAPGHVEQEGDRDRLVALHREILDLLRDALVEKLVVLGGQTGDEAPFPVLDAGGQQHEANGDFLLLLHLENALDRRIVQLFLPRRGNERGVRRGRSPPEGRKKQGGEKRYSSTGRHGRTFLHS